MKEIEIFNGMQFGDRFLTRDGRHAVLPIGLASLKAWAFRRFILMAGLRKRPTMAVILSSIARPRAGILNLLCSFKVERRRNMKCVSVFYKFMSLFLAFFLPAQVWSQITYNEDLSVRNQFTVEEVGRGDLQPGIYYWLFHHSYRNDAAETNKWDYRKNTTLVFLNEKPMSEDIDTAMTQRARIETLNMLDRNPVSDIAWATEQSKIERKQALFQKNISQIIPRGGSSEDRIYWENIYKSIDCGLQAVKGAYMANSQRKQQYLAIYKDLVQRNNELVDCLCLWSGLKKAQEGFEGSLPNFSNSATIARAARDRWVANMAGVASAASGSAGKGSSGKN